MAALLQLDTPLNKRNPRMPRVQRGRCAQFVGGFFEEMLLDAPFGQIEPILQFSRVGVATFFLIQVIHAVGNFLDFACL